MKLNDKSSALKAQPRRPGRSWADVVRVPTVGVGEVVHPTAAALRNNASKDDDEETRTDYTSTRTDSDGDSDSESSPVVKVCVMDPSAANFVPSYACSMPPQTQVRLAEAVGQTRLRSAAPMFVPQTPTMEACAPAPLQVAAAAPIAPPPGLQTPLRSSAAAFVPRGSAWSGW